MFFLKGALEIIGLHDSLNGVAAIWGGAAGFDAGRRAK